MQYDLQRKILQLFLTVICTHLVNNSSLIPIHFNESGLLCNLNRIKSN